MRGRAITFATSVTLFALLPFLQGSSPQLPKQTVALAAGSSVTAQGSTGYPAATAPPAAAGPASGGLAAVSDAIGGGLFVFPALAMTPIVAATATPNAQGISFIRPVPGPEVSPFGPRIHPVLGIPMFHTGIDLMAACGTPIRAAASGTVVYAEVSSSWGLRTIIQHSPTLKTAYGHQSKFLVKEGDVVKQGDIIGLVGTTGWSTGCHLHFDVILNDQYVDPAPYLGLPPSDARSIPFYQTPGSIIMGPTVAAPVDDGDVPIPPDSGTPSPTSSSSTWTLRPTTTTPPPTTTSSPTSSSTSSPTSSSTSSPTSDPTTTTSNPTTTTSDPSTSTTTTTTSDPTTTTTTSDPTTTTSDPSTSTTAATSDPAPSTSTSSSTAGSTSAAEPTASATSSTTSLTNTTADTTTTTDPATSTTTGG